MKNKPLEQVKDRGTMASASTVTAAPAGNAFSPRAPKFGLTALVAASAFFAGGVSAGQFDTGIPLGWTCVGNCGTSPANGNVPLAPGGGSQYGWVSTNNGLTGAGTLPGIPGAAETNGSRLTSFLFAADAGQALEFQFNYVTSDGAGFADYAWARLLDSTLNQVALLFTARTVPSPGNIVPGTNMPAPSATLDPSTVSIQPGTTWAPLGGSSGGCFSSGCGNSGWVQSTYTIADAGNYFLQFGVTNWSDSAFDSGMAFDGITVGGIDIGQPPTGVPEPNSLALLGISLLGLLGLRRRKVTS